MGTVLYALFINFQEFCRKLPEMHNKKVRERERTCDFLMSTHRLYFSSLTKMLVTVVIASSACCETAVQQRLSCFMFTDSRDQEESKLPVCSTIRPIDWLRRAFTALISHTIHLSSTTPVVLFIHQSSPLSHFLCTLQDSFCLYLSLIFEFAFHRDFYTSSSFDNRFKLLEATARPMDKIKLVFSSRCFSAINSIVNSK